ncbi:MAG: hypothetical protein ABEJ65_08040, partial [bacterium]
PIDENTLLATATELSELTREVLLEPSQKRKHVRHRSGLAYACRRYGHMSVSDISNLLSVSESAVSKMIKRFRDRYPSLKKQWDRALNA